MKPESKTINQSRTWAAALCAGLERTWQPPLDLLYTYDIWFRAARDNRFRTDLSIFLRYGCNKRQVVTKRDIALRELLALSH
jgi:hypothetical protein